MKNQYFGDINDYKKYSLLRLLSGQGQIKTTVCWVLTEDDNRTDGSKIKYLEHPDKWRDCDPILYEHLREFVLEKRLRDVSNIEQASILPNCRFFRDFIYDSVEARDNFFKNFNKFSEGTDLVFFDPDNGIEIKSVPRGRKSSSKYVYWDEIRASYDAGHSLMIYQHFPRRPRELFLRNLVRRFRDFVLARQVFSYCTFHTAFILVPQPHHEEMFIENTARVVESWGDKIRVRRHSIIRTHAAV
jgi:hypothetical protein